MDKKRIPIQEGLFIEADSETGKSYLIGNRCRKCGLTAFPKTAVCPRCQIQDTMEEARFEGSGTLDSYSIVQAALPGFRQPSIQAYVNLDNGPKIWSLITGCEPVEGSLKLGMKMEMVIDRVRDDEEGNELISYQFKPAEN
ncbi:MAG: hypothetical protein GX846_11635 [Deltaproteobacteria bacterium]|nr:hypothetical protein [Deltaproteobacteria bacterium]